MYVINYVHHDLRNMFITLVWNVHQYLYHFRPALFVYVQLQSIGLLLSLQYVLIPLMTKLSHPNFEIIVDVTFIQCGLVLQTYKLLVYVPLNQS